VSEGVILTEEDYQAAKQGAINAVIKMLQVGEEIGKEQQAMAMEFMGAFAQAAEKVAG
jgi:hypothetical protein